jgi:hypothetical protein
MKKWRPHSGSSCGPSETVWISSWFAPSQGLVRPGLLVPLFMYLRGNRDGQFKMRRDVRMCL